MACCVNTREWMKNKASSLYRLVAHYEQQIEAAALLSADKQFEDNADTW